MESLVAKLGKLTEQIADAGKWNKYVEASQNCKSLESKISCAESVIRTFKESRPNVRRNNGAGSNGTEFTESTTNLTEVAKSDAVLYKGLGICESDQRRLN